jgi:thioredoxin reductase (NADPH)
LSSFDSAIIVLRLFYQSLSGKIRLAFMNRDVIIIGGGVAGISAGRWCAELGLSALVLEQGGELGGQLLWIYGAIENYPGVKAQNGFELRDRLMQIPESARLEIRRNAEVSQVSLKDRVIELAGGEKLQAGAMIIATGIRRRKLSVAGGEEFAGKGILVSGARDKELARGKDVVIVGGGDAAFENALMLAEVARSVSIVHRSLEFRARKEFRDKVEADPKIKIIVNSVVTRIEGGENVESVIVRNTISNDESTLPAQAVLIRIGVEPNSELFRGQMELDEKGFIAVNERCETSAGGVYAVGDVASPDSMTVSTAAGMGATAAHIILKKGGGAV